MGAHQKGPGLGGLSAPPLLCLLGALGGQACRPSFLSPDTLPTVDGGCTSDPSVWLSVSLSAGAQRCPLWAGRGPPGEEDVGLVLEVEAHQGHVVFLGGVLLVTVTVGTVGSGGARPPPALPVPASLEQGGLRQTQGDVLT